ncbi:MULTISPECIES: dipeptide/tripeptide permease DtpA [unclassified Photobacterium]|uniref:dipeptide/tripeptide permease DtpA n=1 Tax=unclassified Photobacterium TaxID=2628852 RepID=UPI000D17CD75|nr:MULTISPECIES: dipeptide/tripeptide permease DtpA [unclassified Photobacterium]PSV27106.1 dipeptide/tripeptide permease DtpA [Photobacterium sp. GB-56]PSV29666.1 dipeptide/tripeptide permease DtpA [Photobacterium sp. GB-72]PSV35525.1 dipeptide/tripeptide permease DtpA [Photobacterium sp. GB-210]PSV35722.1 dipeptide/tripeptide permease DtpA [Photobacterium sp. GB-27]PSV43087.1 dipeptide/tripeptide permease DtpA [Photobacterium sp. GB-36]
MSELNVFKQPKPFYLIFSIEFWERFGFYGMQAILTVYLVDVLAMSEAESFTLFGAFSALVFGSIAIGGWVGDKIIGTKRTIVLGAIVLMLGYALLGISASGEFNSKELIYIAMGFITIGNGLFKANPSSLLAKVYEKNDPRLDGAFTMYYMAINLGSFISTLLTPWISEHLGYGIAFGVSSIGLLITIANFLVSRRLVKNIGSQPDKEPVNYGKYFIVVIGTILLAFVSAFLLQHIFYAHLILAVVGVTIVTLYFKEALQTTGLERAKMMVAFVLMLQGIVFFVLYFQMPTSLNFFAIHNIHHKIFGIEVQPEQFQALSPFWIMICSPILAMVYNKTRENFSMPYKFALGMVLCSCAFLILTLGSHYADANGIMSSNWLILSYLLQSLGELLVSGLGLAMIAQLVPQRMMGFAMGMWFLTSATAAVIAGWVATLTAAPKGVTDPHTTLEIYGVVFKEIGVITGIIAIITLMMAPKLTRVIQGK